MMKHVNFMFLQGFIKKTLCKTHIRNEPLKSLAVTRIWEKTSQIRVNTPLESRLLHHVLNDGFFWQNFTRSEDPIDYGYNMLPSGYVNIAIENGYL